jgi:tetratricopeptide (TPR) repeat protein
MNGIHARKVPGYPIIVLMLFYFMLSQCREKVPQVKDAQVESEEGSSDTILAEKAVTARTMGLAYLEENNLEAAEKEFLKLTELAPGEALGYANLGLVYLRMLRYDEAEKELFHATELDPRDPDIRLNLARVYEYKGQPEKFTRELEKSLRTDSTHVQTLYALAEYYSRSNDRNAMLLREKYMTKTMLASPTNIVARLYVTEALLRNGKPDEALIQLEELGRLFPDFPEAARTWYTAAMESFHAGDPEKALSNLMIFHNILKLSNQYQNGISELKGGGGSAIGVPVFSFSGSVPEIIPEGVSILDAIRFTDVTAAAGLQVNEGTNINPRDSHSDKPKPHLTLGDLDHDGDQDLYLGTWMEKEGMYRHFLFQADMGRFRDIASNAGLTHKGIESDAIFADYDNDGWFDLLVVAEGSLILYKSTSEARYKNVTAKAKLESTGRGKKALFLDADHEGDLDLFIAGSGTNSLLRNNGDGTFTDYSAQAEVEGEEILGMDACFGDFDDDGDIDLFVLNRNGENELFSNQREGRFRNITTESGLAGTDGSSAADCGDYNNDGYLDLLVSGTRPGGYKLYRNMGDGTFISDESFVKNPDILKNTLATDVAFLDFDNDGHLDILISGVNTAPDGKGVHLLHNTGDGTFEDASKLLPGDLIGGGQIGIADYNEDGDLDIFLTGTDSGVRLLRNDGGNANHRLQVRLVGVKAGSGKNNHYGIGCKVEVRSGDLYQMRVATEPVIYFGLGQKSRADVVRILWTNGTPQNIFSPGTEQDLIEEQQLKGSCPFLYTWNGDQFTFIKDIMWHSALGMPMGIMGGTTTYGFPEASGDYMKIPGDKLQPAGGKYTLQVTEELWETIYLDKAELITIDHPDTIEVMVNEKFSPPPWPAMRMYRISGRIIPVSAKDGKGNDVLEMLSKEDDRYVANFLKTDFQGITELRELILDPGSLKKTEGLHLFLNGWIFPTDASINKAIAQSEKNKVTPPYLQVINENGEWETIIPNLGFPAGKAKTVIADLDGKFLSEDCRVRIITNMEIYWDQAYFAYDLPQVPVISVKVRPDEADHHYRGFSEMYRKGGRYGPHWFDYNSVSTSPRWRDLTGSYTRYGVVSGLLEEADDRYIIANAGDETTMTFNENLFGDLPDGWKRDFVIHTIGWVKDGDLNTASGQTVEPLPFHGMSRYPYGENESYPVDRKHIRYQNKYNTRIVDTKEFREALVLNKVEKE